MRVGSEHTSGISVVGHGEVTGPPDLGIVTIGVDCRGDTVAAASADANRAAAALVDAIRGLDIAERDIQTSRLSISPDHDHSGPVRRLLGYRSATTLVVLVRDLDRLASVIDAAVGAAADATVLEGVRFAVVDDAARLDEARARAWADARRKAEQLADLAGVTLGDVVAVEEQLEGESFSPYGAMVGAKFSMDAAMAPVVAPGELCSAVDVSVRFAIDGPAAGRGGGWGFAAAPPT